MEKSKSESYSKKYRILKLPRIRMQIFGKRDHNSSEKGVSSDSNLTKEGMRMNNLDEFGEKNQFTKIYSEKSLFTKIKMYAQKAGISAVYAVLLLYYAFQKTGIPAWAKAVIGGSLGYFIIPIDAVPDVMPGGYTDDLGVLIAALVTVAVFIDDDVKLKAKSKLRDWFGDYDMSSLDDIDNKINSKTGTED